MKESFNSFRKGLIVSCQSEGNSPFNNPGDMAKFAVCAQMGGASAIRAEGLQKIRAILNAVSLPLIGLIKSSFPDGSVLITGKEKDITDLVEAGCQVVALDGTFRLREHMDGPSFIRHIKSNHQVNLLADVSTLEEGLACLDAGADAVATTLSGYTPGHQGAQRNMPDFKLLKKLVDHLGEQIPVIAEGRINTPELAREAIGLGAWAVVAGTAITRPQTITKWYKDAIKA